jgi:TonB family protein
MMKTMKQRRAGIFLPALLLAGVFAVHPARAQWAASADSLRAYELGEVEVMPELANRSEVAGLIQRHYPREMRRKRETGMVTVRFLVRPDGRVDSTRVSVLNSDNEGFNDAAVNVIRRARFAPARVDGQPVAVWVMFPLIFRLEPRSAPPTRAPGDARSAQPRG